MTSFGIRVALRSLYQDDNVSVISFYSKDTTPFLNIRSLRAILPLQHCNSVKAQVFSELFAPDFTAVFMASFYDRFFFRVSFYES